MPASKEPDDPVVPQNLQLLLDLRQLATNAAACRNVLANNGLDALP